MYRALSSLLFVTALTLTLPTAADTPGDEPIDIRADSGRYDGTRGATFLSGNIRIARGEMVVQADEGYAFQGSERSYERIELEGSPATWRAIDEEGEEIQGQAGRIIFDVPTNRIALQDGVRIERGELIVRADSGEALQADGRYQRIELEGQPAQWTITTAEGQRVEGESDRFIHDLVAEQLTMLGHARVREPRGSFTGQRLLYDLRTQATEGDGGIHMIIDPDAVDERGGDRRPD
jgi:lipopolysaccharide export system protein LptA